MTSQLNWTKWDRYESNNFHFILYMPENYDLRIDRDDYWLHIYKQKESDKEWILRFGSAQQLPAQEDIIGKYADLKTAKIAYKMYVLAQPK